MRYWNVLFSLAALILNSQGQLPSGPSGGGMSLTPRGFFAGGMSQLFGENSAFSANMVVQAKGQAGLVSVPGKVAFLDGKSRFEMDATKMKDANMRPEVIEQIKSMGMAEVQTITLPEKKETYLIYPGLKSYAVIPGNGDGDSKSKAEPKKVEQGKETVDGHPTTKYKVTVKDDQGEQEFTVWNASDLKNFPIKIQMNNQASPTIITFSDVKLAKPEEAIFRAPADFQRYNDLQTMMREVMMKRFAPPAGATPAPGK